MTNQLKEHWVQWRHHLHEHPELGFNEKKTANFVIKILNQYGIETYSEIGQTGVVGILKRGNSKKSIGIRADMDALPINESNEFKYRSRYKNRFHGCGHDGHTVMLLAAAEKLASTDKIDGTVYFIFQPNEENGLGATAMIEDGLFERFHIDAVYGMHNMPGMSLGTIAVRKGVMMAFEDNFVINILGSGGHSSMPHRCKDPVVVGAELINALQTVVSRCIDPLDSAVISVTEILSDGARNIIPSNVTIKGDIRGFSKSTQDIIEKRIKTLVVNIARAHDLKININYTKEFTMLENSDRETDIAIKAAIDVVGNDNIILNCQPVSCSEDFAKMLKIKPGSYILIGNGIEGCYGKPLHNPHYDFNDELLEIGSAYWVKLVENELELRHQ